MKSAFSEFSYGFAFTHGLINDLPGIRSAPFFPSLVAEGNTGTDVELDFLGMPLFFQFKLSDYLVRPTAKYWSVYGSPYFRFDITPLKRSRQHNLLKALTDGGEPDVYYVAPLFSETSAFNDAFLANQVASRSIWIPVQRLPRLSDYEQHHITFTSPESFCWHTTEGEEIRDDFSGERIASEFRDRFASRRLREINRDWVGNLRTELNGILRQEQQVTELQNLSADFGNNLEGLRDIQYLLTTFFHLRLEVLQDRPILGT